MNMISLHCIVFVYMVEVAKRGGSEVLDRQIWCRSYIENIEYRSNMSSYDSRIYIEILLKDLLNNRIMKPTSLTVLELKKKGSNMVFSTDLFSVNWGCRADYIYMWDTGIVVRTRIIFSRLCNNILVPLISIITDLTQINYILTLRKRRQTTDEAKTSISPFAL